MGDAIDDIAAPLGHEGLEILQVSEAQAVQTASPGDVIVCDAKTSRTALDLCTQLRRSLRAPSLAVVSSHEAAEQALDAGYDDVIVAPYNPRELRLRVRNLLRGAERTTVRAVAQGEQLWTAEQLARTRYWREEVQEPWERLTGRERKVLALVAEGKTDEEIAQELQITKKTVGHHVSSILGKLGVASRTEAALWAVRKGLIE